MQRVIIVPDSFKGTLSSNEICEIVREEILRVFPESEVYAYPMADGGEGTVDAFLNAVGGERIGVPCHGPYMEPIVGSYGLLPDKTAVIEMASAVGLPLVDRPNPDKTTTYGVGELLSAAAENGAAKIILALGGSATNDGGCGAAAALGAQFLDFQGNTFLPTGGNLDQLARINLENQRHLPPVTVMCDVDCTLCGPDGASLMFAPQKGADTATAKRLDHNLAHLAEVIQRDLGIHALDISGGGAGGGMGCGAVAFWDGHLQKGIETMLDIVHFDRIVQTADLVITGEGRLDRQSAHGKVIAGVSRRAKKANTPVIAIVGAIGDGADDIYRLGVCSVFTINHRPEPYDVARLYSRDNLRRTVRNLMTFLNAMNTPKQAASDTQSLMQGQ